MKGREMSSSPTYVRLSSSNDAEATSSPRKGYVPVLVGTDNEDMERLCIPVKLINHPSLASLLDDSVLDLGYTQHGLLRVSCGAEDFKEIVKNISRRKYVLF
nr:auxin-responsive protein SAUR40-like [Coffea arabica]